MIRNENKKFIITSILVVLTFMIGVFVFFHFYNNYIDEILYKERLSQMEEVTSQLFTGVDNIIEQKWENAKAQCNGIEEYSPRTLDELYDYMNKQSSIFNMDDRRIKIVAIDSTGKYYTQDGPMGLLREISYIESNEEKISYVSNSMSSGQNSMVFLYRLKSPITLNNGNKKVIITYYGTSQNMEELSDYFACKAYDNTNSVYVVDDDGLKLFSDNDNELISGYNVYTSLKNMRYLHDSSFDKTKEGLNNDGQAYSNTILDGTEYYYALKKMANAKWTMVFIVPSSSVAVNTVVLVNSAMRIIIVFGIFMLTIMAIVIIAMLKARQKQVQQAEIEKRISLEKTNRELDETNEKLKLSIEATQSAFEVAKEANKSKSDFLANMSHDIRTPMNAIIGMTTLIEHDATSPNKVLEYSHKIEKASQQLLGLINDVLDMSKIESGKTKLNSSDFLISDVLDQIDTIFTPQVAERKQNFKIETVNIKHDYLNGDNIRLLQILNNIISNAVKYTQDGGNISLTVKEIEYDSNTYTKLSFEIDDNGMGISEEYIDKIFDSFTREENSLTNHIQGTGLGMAITKNLVDLMGGTITVNSKKGEGSHFEVILGFKIAKEEKEESLQEEKQSDNKPSLALMGANLLCAEDNKLNAEILKELLRMQGATCKICENGKELVEVFEKSKPGDYDLILMDVQMPVMNGYEATAAIRNSSHPLAKTMPIIAMTANTFSEDIQNCLKVGMNAHVPKPVDMKVLEKTIQNLKSGGVINPDTIDRM